MALLSFARKGCALLLLSVAAMQPAWCWGPDGHRMINRIAAAKLPKDVPSFLRDKDGQDTLEYLGPEPDRWRNRAEEELSKTQGPDHFIDLEWAEFAEVPCHAADSACINGRMLPRLRYDFIRSLAAARRDQEDLALTPEKVGMQPWQVEEVWQRLKADFREFRTLTEKRADTRPVQVAILFDAGWLGHYVGDGSQPLHTTIQYNGWVGPNPHGYTTDRHFHAGFETDYVHSDIDPRNVEKRVGRTRPQVIDDEWAQYLGYLYRSHSLVEKTYQLEKAGGFNGYGTPEAQAFTEERLAAGAIELRDLIYSAWVHSADAADKWSE